MFQPYGHHMGARDHSLL